jgi:hypothetical protein
MVLLALGIRRTELQDCFEAFLSVHSCSQSLLLFQLNARNIIIVGIKEVTELQDVI